MPTEISEASWKWGLLAFVISFVASLMAVFCMACCMLQSERFSKLFKPYNATKQKQYNNII